jgi:hypothetical protein
VQLPDVEKLQTLLATRYCARGLPRCRCSSNSAAAATTRLDPGTASSGLETTREAAFMVMGDAPGCGIG